jgi:uncharacterized membrane protein YeaQ/YmgE (transglycosylase-associated protein family)
VAFLGFIALGLIAGVVASMNWGRREPSMLFAMALVGTGGSVTGGELAHMSGMGNRDAIFSAATAVAVVVGLASLHLYDELHPGIEGADRTRV